MDPIDLSHGRTFSGGFPHGFFAWLRAEHPVWWHEPTAHTPEGEGFWVVSRHADALAMLRDPATFSSELGGTELATLGGQGIQLVQTDDPAHLRLRALVNKGFTPRMIGRLEDDLRRRARAIVAGLPAGEVVDLVPPMGDLPLQAICLVLGVPQEERAHLGELVDRALTAETGEILAREHMRALARYCDELVEEKRTAPADDILSVIVHATLDDGSPRLSTKELRAFFTLLFPAGAETTRTAITSGVQAFVDHPEQLEALRARPDLMRTAVEEIVRWTTPSVYKRRTTTRDVELRGVPIGKGQKVTLWEASANRDEDVFDEPFRFDIARDPNPHVGFGFGTHFCLGASLARLEIKVVFEELLARFERFEPAGDAAWAPNNRLVGLTTLPMRLHPPGGG